MNISNLRVTPEQVKLWVKTGGEWPDKFTTHPNYDKFGWDIVYDSAGDCWCIELGRANNNDKVIDVVRADSKIYRKIFEIPTVFAHALECMQKAKVVFAQGWLCIWRFNEGKCQTLEDKWQDMPHLPLTFDWEFYLRPDIDWETGKRIEVK
jgi:hypothetical protein